MFVFVITAPSAVVELHLFNDVVKDGLLMFFWCLFGDMLSQLYFHMLETFILFSTIHRAVTPEMSLTV